MKMLTHNRRSLALHKLRAGDGLPLLLLHGLAETSAIHRLDQYDVWLGPVFAMDLVGHGHSDSSIGHGYSPEGLLSDVDIAVAELDRCAVAGRGLGAYLALMIAGARPEQVVGCVLLDGPGLRGGGPESNVLPASWHATAGSEKPDPYVLIELSTDVRPPNYATKYAQLAARNPHHALPISIVAHNRPAWLAAVADMPTATATNLTDALNSYQG
ncbi:MAG: alpha/beta fold hydrolase, partial [Acidimicrobiales bacterium]